MAVLGAVLLTATGCRDVRLKPEVLPFSNLAAHLTPFLLSPDKAMRIAAG